MADQLKALDALIEAVEAGDAGATILLEILSTAMPQTNAGCMAMGHQAYHGSLDAAHDLHEALLPGWRARLDIGRRNRCWIISPDNEKLDAYGQAPSRAWLIAILRAYRGTLANG